MRRALATVVLVALVGHGCAAATPGVAVRPADQDAQAAERDERECRERAAAEVDSPVGAGLAQKAAVAVAGAGFGVLIVLSAAASSAGPIDPEAFFLVLGGAAALGFVVGSIVGTFKGAAEGSRLARAREDVFRRCMAERGYQFQ